MPNIPVIAVAIALFALVTVLGFAAARWRRGDLSLLSEWGLAGRRFGTLVSWFLIGGDLYTAYTFIAVPALVFGAGAQGFFAVPYTAIVYPFVFIVIPRLWLVAHRRGHITVADFARERFDSSGLALALALTGILATMPYIALQLVGMQVVIADMGLRGDWPIVIAFAILAGYTYASGLRGPAMVAFVKDSLIYITVIAAIIIIPAKLGGFAHIFSAAAQALPTHKPPGAFILPPKLFLAYSTLALGSGLALFMYPHAITASLSASGPAVIRRNAIALPAYSLVLGIIALFGYMAIAADIHPKTPQYVVPDLILKMFPPWFAGFAFGAIGIGALVPAAVMSIAAANLFTRNIYKEYLNRNATDKQESHMARVVSLIVKLGALLFALFVRPDYAINLQLLGGSWILQTFPTVVLGLYTTWFHRRALLVGWLAGMIAATWMASTSGFKSALYPLPAVAETGYVALYALLINLLVAVVLTWVFDAAKVARGHDKTLASDYV